MKLMDDLRIENEMNANENNVDSTLPETLTEITDDDSVKTAWGKIKKIVIDFLAHIKLAATASVLGHVRVKSGNGLEYVDETIGMAKASNSEYGATQLANNTTTSSSGEYALDAYQGKVLAESIAKKAPKAHASTTTEYGLGDEDNYGHVKVSDTYKSKLPEGAAEDGVVASQNALYNAYNEIKNNLVHMNRYIVAGIQNNFTSTSNSQLVPLDRTINNVNNGFELHDGFIKCLYDGNVQVSGATYLNNEVTATLGAGITNLNTLDGASVQSYTQANAYPVLSIPTKILSVSKGDLLQFSYRNPNGIGDVLFNTNSTFVCAKYI